MLYGTQNDERVGSDDSLACRTHEKGIYIDLTDARRMSAAEGHAPAPSKRVGIERQAAAVTVQSFAIVFARSSRAHRR
jgi:hypothetical protein